MSNIVGIGNTDSRLCGELAAAIAWQVTCSDENVERGQKGARFWHMFDSTLERASSVLTSLGLLEPCTDGEYALTRDADTIPDFLDSTVDDAGKHLPEVLSSFLAVACNYGDLSDEREPFTAPRHFQNALHWLARTGYTEQTGETYRWTDKIGTAMQKAHLWDEQLRSYTSCILDHVEAEARAAWQTMPDTIRRAHFSRRPVDLMAFAVVLMRCWVNGKWMPPNEEVMPSLHSFEIARRIIQISKREI